MKPKNTSRRPGSSSGRGKKTGTSTSSTESPRKFSVFEVRKGTWLAEALKALRPDQRLVFTKVLPKRLFRLRGTRTTYDCNPPQFGCVFHSFVFSEGRCYCYFVCLGGGSYLEPCI